MDKYDVLADHPSQSPWTGSRYVHEGRRKLLWVAECVKLPPTESVESDDWYAMTDQQLMEGKKLTAEGLKWITISGNIAEGIKRGRRWPQVTYRRIDKALEAVGRDMNDIRFANFFVRPAPNNGWLELNKHDIKVARSAFIAELDREEPPDVIIISSTRAVNFLGCHVLDALQKKRDRVLYTTHPAAYGKSPRCRPELIEFLQTRWLGGDASDISAALEAQ